MHTLVCTYVHTVWRHSIDDKWYCVACADKTSCTLRSALRHQDRPSHKKHAQYYLDARFRLAGNTPGVLRSALVQSLDTSGPSSSFAASVLSAQHGQPMPEVPLVDFSALGADFEGGFDLPVRAVDEMGLDMERWLQDESFVVSSSSSSSEQLVELDIDETGECSTRVFYSITSLRLIDSYRLFGTWIRVYSKGKNYISKRFALVSLG